MSIGNPIQLTNNVASKVISVTATGSQTLFTVTGGYRINQLGVFRNGTRLVDGLDYTARDGATVTLLSPASGSDVIEFQVFDDFRVADALNVNSGGTVNGAVTIVSAATTALLVDGNARVTGILTVGNSSITLDGANNSINIGSVSIAETGITGGTSDIVTRNITGVAATFTGNVSIAGTLTYEDVTNIDSVGLITARSGVILTGGDITLGTGTTISAPTANEFAVSTNGGERLRVDSSGNINVDSGGVFYDATNNRLSVGTTSITGFSDYTTVQLGSSISGSALRLVASGDTPGTDDFVIYKNTSGSYLRSYGDPLVFYGSSSEYGRFDTSGRLLVGVSSSSSVGGAPAIQQIRFSSASYGLSVVRESDIPIIGLGRANGSGVQTVNNGDTLGRVAFVGADGSSFNPVAAYIEATVDGTPGTNDMPGRLVFSTTSAAASSPTERMRINRVGEMYCHTESSNWNHVIYNGSSAGTANRFYSAYHSSTGLFVGTNSYVVYTNGNVVNTNNSYGSLSDVKLKENIVDASSQWNDLKALQVRKYNFKEETGQQTHTQLGLIAQEVELVSPGLVTESPDRDAEGNDLGTVTKSVNYSVLYMKAVKALQEAQERIETLEAQNAAILARLDAAGI